MVSCLISSDAVCFVQKLVDWAFGILETHEYSMTTVLLEAAKTFKLPSIIKKAGFEKAQGYSVTPTIMLMMLLPFLVLNRVNDLCLRAIFAKSPR